MNVSRLKLKKCLDIFMTIFQYQSMSDSYLGDMAARSEDLHGADTGVNGKVCAWLQHAQDPDSCTQGIF